MLTTIVQNTGQEYQASIKWFSTSVVIAHIELLLTCAERFYQRQFTTGKISRHEILNGW